MRQISKRIFTKRGNVLRQVEEAETISQYEIAVPFIFLLPQISASEAGSSSRNLETDRVLRHSSHLW